MTNNDHQRAGGWVTPALLGAVLGPALQLQQPVLSGWPAYGLMAAAAAIVLFGSLFIRLRAGARAAGILLATALLAFGLTGLRASWFAAQALDPALEGRDVTVVGVVVAMPQRNDTGLRFRLKVESATVGGSPARLVPQLYLGWYGGAVPDAAGRIELLRQAPELRAGERWQMNVRLKAPHGNSNPHGFDYELWLWEQGLQATGYVRAGPNDPAPRRLADTWRHPVERARQAVRDAVFEQVADRRTAGLLAALIVGDQNAIDLGNFCHCLLPRLPRFPRRAVISALWGAHSLLTPAQLSCAAAIDSIS